MNDKSLTTASANKISVSIIDWNDPAMQMQIKESYGSKLSEQEWKLFLGLGKATGLNPFLREIWAVKYGTSPASIFIGRDGYRRSAEAHPEYDYHEVDAVYSNDEFSHKNGIVDHKYDLKNRGEVVGAYCIVKRKSASRPVVNFIDVTEYDLKQSVWNTKKATMAKKVAEAQGLRASFQELFAGTYEESEQDLKKAPVVDAPPLPTTEELIKKLDDCKTAEELDAAAQEVSKAMAHLSEKEQKEVMKKGKEMRKRVNEKKEGDEITDEEKEEIRKSEAAAEENARQSGLGL